MVNEALSDRLDRVAGIEKKASGSALHAHTRMRSYRL